MNVKSKVEQAVQEHGGARSTMSFLRLEQVFLNNSAQTGAIEFALKTGNGVKNTPNEVRLKEADGFTALMMSVCVGKVTIATANTPTLAELASVEMQTFPNVNVFTAAEAAAMRAIYNGYTLVNIGGTDFLPNFENTSYQRVGAAQKATGPATTYASNEWSGPNYGYAPLYRSISFDGNQNITIKLQLPTQVSLNPAVNTQAHIITLRIGGVLHPNKNDK